MEKTNRGEGKVEEGWGRDMARQAGIMVHRSGSLGGGQRRRSWGRTGRDSGAKLRGRGEMEESEGPGWLL